MMVKTRLTKRFLLAGAAATAIAAAPVAGAVFTGSTYLADPPAPCYDVNAPGCAGGGANVNIPGAGAMAGPDGAGVNVPGASAGAGHDGAIANVPGAGVVTGPNGASASAPGANANAGPDGAGFCVNGWCANAGR